MKPKCKCYTYSTVLFAPSNRSTSFKNNYIPSVNINADDCCIKNQEFLRNEETQMEPVELTNLNLDELRHSQHKLEQLEEVLQNDINKPFALRHSSWFTTVLAILAIMFLLCCCCNCSWLPYIGKFWPRRKSCCGFPSVCITNHNERLEINEEQMLRLSRLRRLNSDEDVSAHSLVPIKSYADNKHKSVSKRLSLQDVSSISNERRFQV